MNVLRAPVDALDLKGGPLEGLLIVGLEARTCIKVPVPSTLWVPYGFFILGAGNAMLVPSATGVFIYPGLLSLEDKVYGNPWKVKKGSLE